MATQQRRRWERCRKELEVVVTGDGAGHEIVCRTLDLCEGGLGVVCDETLEAGREYRFAIPAITPDPLPGLVRWCTGSPASGGFQIGVELDGMTARQTEDLAESIARWRAEAVDRTG